MARHTSPELAGTGCDIAEPTMSPGQPGAQQSALDFGVEQTGIIEAGQHP